MKLSDREWKKFKICDIFNIDSGKDINEGEIIEGNIPYITATSFDNGVKHFVSNINKTLERNVISVNRTGSVGYAFYHKYEALYSNNCRKLKFKKQVNQFVALFLTNQIMQQKIKYNYGYIMGTERLNKQYITLPVNEKNEPDYAFMEDYIKQKYEIREKKYNKYVKESIKELKCKKIIPLSEKKWEGFSIDDLFYIKSGKRLTKKNMIEGNMPFIGSIDSNNGITNFISNINNSLDSNVLGVNYNGSVCEVFYHPYECIFSDDVKHISLKNIQGNKYIYLFFKSIIYKQKIKYTYGYKFNENRMKRQIIMVPVNDKNEPDYEYMEQYIKNTMKQKYNKYININQETC
ncbi:restriction endonuclease subunit S [Terrisporobacter mayombei]|uniref:Restriction enzyme BgcI subunit beta n=1 Tax=Terrisporobacter mayombei TaxID=1541 RepID=A0ABY9Q5F6_9FIRM|nr:restriction endonuclease subunit S [Terrisporobacter mayombei]MCC3870027.1 restriction endonuclease subunit S [Terrisporobacter mayombei]WMT82479.1 Restriction enzyme BgcI subunit beta [Terrisporobacter mayombei]